MLSVNTTLHPVILHAGTEKNLIKPSELDIYHEPEPSEVVVQKPPYPAIVYDNVSVARRSLTGVFSGLLTTHEKISEFFGSVNNRVTNVYIETIEDPYFLLTPGAIATATIGGALFAGRGKGRFTRSLYAGLFGITATAVSYPQRSLEIATTGYYHTSASLSNIVQLWKERSANVTEKVMKKIDNEREKNSIITESTEKVEENVVLSESAVVEDNIIMSPTEKVDDTAVLSESTVTVENIVQSETTVADENTSNSENDILPTQKELKVVIEEIIKVDDLKEQNVELNSELKVEADYGQSDPEDKDMYSTRS